MATQIFLQNKYDNEVLELGIINSDSLDKLIDIATYYNLQCLPYLDSIGNTILNQKQLNMLKSDLEYMRNIITDQNAFDMLLSFVKTALQYSELFLFLRGE